MDYTSELSQRKPERSQHVMKSDRTWEHYEFDQLCPKFVLLRVLCLRKIVLTFWTAKVQPEIGNIQFPTAVGIKGAWGTKNLPVLDFLHSVSSGNNT